MTSVAIIGAGVAGLAAAWELNGVGIRSTVFEASGRLGGRASTVERGGARFDDGAQFFRTETPLAEEVVLRRLPAGDLLDIRRDVRPFDGDGALGAGDPVQNAAPKWVYRQGISQIARLLWRGSGATVHLAWRVEELARGPRGWALKGERGTAGPFERVLITAPPAAARELVAASAFDSPTRDTIHEALAAATHRPIISVALGFTDAVEAPENAYAIVNIDRKHAVSWLAFEDAKPGYVPAGRGVLVAQMAGGWSTPRMEANDRELVLDATEEVSGLLGRALAPSWSIVTRWAEALPDRLVDPAALAGAEPLGLYFAGDAQVGGRLHLALESGIGAARRITTAMG